MWFLNVTLNSLTPESLTCIQKASTAEKPMATWCQFWKQNASGNQVEVRHEEVKCVLLRYYILKCPLRMQLILFSILNTKHLALVFHGQKIITVFLRSEEWTCLWCVGMRRDNIFSSCTIGSGFHWTNKVSFEMMSRARIHSSCSHGSITLDVQSN